jgi:uncharacterized membrane protein YfbV (UPF0208 family)
MEKSGPQALAELLNGYEDRFIEIDAALTTQRFVIEQLLANAFISAPEALDAFIAGLVTATQRRVTTQEPISAEAREEMQARVAARLLRLGASARRRIEQDR